MAVRESELRVLRRFGQYRYHRAIDTLWMNSPSQNGRWNEVELFVANAYVMNKVPLR